MLNNKLREIREGIGISLSELAKRANVSRQTITNIELHGHQPNGRVVIAIGEALKKDPREIFYVEEGKELNK